MPSTPAKDDPEAMAMLCSLLRERGRHDEALATGAAALAAAPSSLAVRMAVTTALSRGVPGFHVPMLRDQARNEAYARAITQMVRPGMKVLEIGCGAGLLAMTAARAGAEVITCESDPMIAAAARDVIRANSLSDRIQVVAKSSLDMSVPEDLPERADLVIHEIFGRRLFDEGVVRALTHARERLLKPDAPSIPASAAIRFALVRDDRSRSGEGLHDVLGFDLTAFQPLHSGHEGLRQGTEGLQLASGFETALAMNFDRPPPFGPTSERVAISVRCDRIDAVVQWMRIDLGHGDVYENSPFASGPKSHWDAALLSLPQPIGTNLGESVEVTLRHRSGLLTIDVAAPKAT